MNEEIKITAPLTSILRGCNELEQEIRAVLERRGFALWAVMDKPSEKVRELVFGKTNGK